MLGACESVELEVSAGEKEEKVLSGRCIVLLWKIVRGEHVIHYVYNGSA